MANASDMVTSGAIVCIPWRPGPGREAAFDRVIQWYGDRNYRVVTADSDPALPFNLSQARNRAASEAQRTGARALVIADADTIPDEKALRSAARRALSQYRVFYPFSEYVYLEPGSEGWNNPADAPVTREFHQSVGGVVVCNTHTFEVLNGFDENFRQWGYEDNAFMLAAECLVGIERIEGTVYAYGHEAERDLTSDNPGRARVRLYHFARNDKDVMRELIRTNDSRI